MTIGRQTAYERAFRDGYEAAMKEVIHAEFCMCEVCRRKRAGKLLGLDNPNAPEIVHDDYKLED